MYKIKIRVTYEPYFIYIDNVVRVETNGEFLYVYFCPDDETFNLKIFGEFEYYELRKKV